MQPIVIILAAGRGERFLSSGGETHKLQANLAGKPVQQHVLDAVKASGLPWHRVEPQHNQHIRNPGMGDSIATGVRATAHASGWLILPADLPLISPLSLKAIAEALQHDSVVVPCYQGQAGHPVGFSKVCGSSLMQLQGDQGARTVVQAWGPAHRIELNDQGCVLDVDTVQSLQLASEILKARQSG
jgi:molybdenum cofactor cytidylyltransferase